MSKSHTALKGFQCMAVYDAPQVETESESKKKKSSNTNHTASPSSSPLIRYLYYKSHSTAAGADDGLKPGCTLFVVNIPFHYTSEHLTQLFNCFGTVEQVSFLQAGLQLQFDMSRIGSVEPSSFYRSAHIVYEEEESHDMAIKTDLSQTPQQCPEEDEDEQNVGLKSQSIEADGWMVDERVVKEDQWISHYHSTRPLVSALQLQVDRFMEGFDARTASEKAAARSGVTTDADGWTLVKGSTRSKKRQALQLEEESNRAREQANKKLKKNTVVHFYKHQEREQKKERLLQLREKFEQDKLKIAKMKQERKFKPY